MNEIEPAPQPPVPAKSYPGIAQSIGLCLLFYGIVVAVTIALHVLERFTSLSLDKAAALLIEQLVAWPLTLWAGLRRSKRSFREVFPLTRFPVRIVPALVIASIGAAILLSAVAHLIPMSEEFKDALTRIFADSNQVVAFFAAVVAAPVAEELFCRGLILRGYLGRYSVTKAVWASAIFFAVFHMNPWQAVIALPLGLGCAWLFLRTGSLIPAMLCHASANSTGAILPPLGRLLGYDEEVLEALDYIPLSFLVIGAAMAIGGGFILWRQLAARPLSES